MRDSENALSRREAVFELFAQEAGGSVSAGLEKIRFSHFILTEEMC